MSRTRGFNSDWTPRPDRQRLIDNVRDILDDNSDILPLTLRQIFYMLVSNYSYDKTQPAYKRLCETMNMARRAFMIDMRSIRDDELVEKEVRGWGSRAGFLNHVMRNARNFTLGRQDNQEIKTFIWCEAGGMVPQLLNAVEDLHVPVLSSGGFDSTTTKHNFAQQIAHHDHVCVLHLGDHDPSGVHMFSSLEEDITAFWDHYTDGGLCKTLEFVRLAVTPAQIDEMDLPTAPAKATDNRSFKGLTTQCEAIPPRRLRDIVRERVMHSIDENVLEETLEREKEISAELAEKFKEII